jgi:hypothetical protein
MRKLLDQASAAQNLDGDRLKGSLLRPLQMNVVQRKPRIKRWRVQMDLNRVEFDPARLSRHSLPKSARHGF